MGKKYVELEEIPIPEEAHINHNTGRVFTLEKLTNGVRKPTYIGYATSETTMCPNTMFKNKYPDLWKEYYGEEDYMPHELYCGMYAASLGIGYETQLYPILQSVFGLKTGNAIMDFSLYTIINRRNTICDFESKMRDHYLYSDKAYSDSWYSDLFQTKISLDSVSKFRIAWLNQCVKNNITKVWLSIDGSNTDCNISDSDLCNKGKSKSKINTNIVSYIWAVNADDGTPVTYFINDGSKTDSKAFQEIIAFLHESKIEIQGVILDCGFTNHSVVTTLIELGIPYVMMLKSNHYGHIEMMKQYGETIRTQVRHLIDSDGIFGIVDKKQLFSQYPEEAYVALYFDCINGMDRLVTQIKKILKLAQIAEEAIAKGTKPKIPSKYQKTIEIKSSGKKKYVVLNYDEWQNVLDTKGYYSIASSENLTAKEIHQIYTTRDCSEKQYMIMKSQMGYNSAHVHTDKRLEVKFAMCFIAAILRSKFMNVCHSFNYDTNSIIQELDQIYLLLLTNEFYTAVYKQSKRQLKILREFGILQTDLTEFATDINTRNKTNINSQVRRLPNDPNRYSHKKIGRPSTKVNSDSQQEKRKPGRPKGSKNKKTLEREAKIREIGEPEKRRPGRPKGSKNKKTLKREAKMLKYGMPEKRKPGRPKGSKNKIKVKRGRPLGSKNKPKEKTSSEQ